MVKVSINGYEAPLTVWHIVELEDGVCHASPDIQNPDEQEIGRSEAQDGNKAFKPTFEDAEEWD